MIIYQGKELEAQSKINKIHLQIRKKRVSNKEIKENILNTANKERKKFKINYQIKSIAIKMFSPHMNVYRKKEKQ